jgi:hypothetical protein
VALGATVYEALAPDIINHPARNHVRAHRTQSVTDRAWIGVPLATTDTAGGQDDGKAEGSTKDRRIANFRLGPDLLS